MLCISINMTEVFDIFETIETPAEKKLFRKIYRKYEGIMYDTAYSILLNRFDAEDAVHTAFTNIAGHLDKISDINSTGTKGYLIIAAKHAALKTLAANKKFAFPETDEPEADDIDVEEYVIRNMEAGRLEAVLLGLPAADYEVLFLNIYMDLDIREISETLCITYDAAKKRLQRALKRFREAAAKEGII
ncbi:MAG: sigma-70 family RNA polymerase sigma factor [Ruminococcus sp.]|nr:sigma-70 family RNA polymerase sigma factor [Ruminococcus sp.]